MVKVSFYIGFCHLLFRYHRGSATFLIKAGHYCPRFLMFLVASCLMFEQPLVWRIKFRLCGKKNNIFFCICVATSCFCSNLSHPSLCFLIFFRNFTCSGWRNFAASSSSHIFSRRMRWDSRFSPTIPKQIRPPSLQICWDLLTEFSRLLLRRLWGALFCSCTTLPERPKFGWLTLGRRFHWRPRWPWTTGLPGLKATGRTATCGDWTTS